MFPFLQLERKGLNLPSSEAVSKKAKKLEGAKNSEFKDEDIEQVCVCVCVRAYVCAGMCVYHVCFCALRYTFVCLSTLCVPVSVHAQSELGHARFFTFAFTTVCRLFWRNRNLERTQETMR